MSNHNADPLQPLRHSAAHIMAQAVLELFPDNRILRRWIELARKRIKFQGLPARICWLGYGERAQFGLAINDLVKKGKIKSPIGMGRDHLDCGSVASPPIPTRPAPRASAQTIDRRAPPPAVSATRLLHRGRSAHLQVLGFVDVEPAGPACPLRERTGASPGTTGYM